MSGSRKTFLYITDNNLTLLVNMDESNGEAVGNTDYDTQNPTQFGFGMLKGIRPRRAFYQSDDGRVSKSIILSTAAQINTIPQLISAFFPTSATAITTVQLRLKSVQQESRVSYTPVDTGLNDGDFT